MHPVRACARAGCFLGFGLHGLRCFAQPDNVDFSACGKPRKPNPQPLGVPNRLTPGNAKGARGLAFETWDPPILTKGQEKAFFRSLFSPCMRMTTWIIESRRDDWQVIETWSWIRERRVEIEQSDQPSLRLDQV